MTAGKVGSKSEGGAQGEQHRGEQGRGTAEIGVD